MLRSGTSLHSLNSIAYAVRMSNLPWKRTVIALILFGTAFGYLEAAAVATCGSCTNRRASVPIRGDPRANCSHC